MQVFRHLPAVADRPIALTIGNFDGIHRGHQAMLTRLVSAAREHGLPACVLTFEPHPREFLSPADAPARLSTLRMKLERMRDFGVDRVYICRFDRRLAELGPDAVVEEILLHRLDTRWLLVGDDFRFGAKRSGDFDLLQRHGTSGGFHVTAMPSILVRGERVSSTTVRSALAAGDLAFARECLGHPYRMAGHVGHGDKIGRTLGFPTANVGLRRGPAPLYGVFAVELSGFSPQPWPGVASLGTRPTVTDSGRATLEVHLFDFDGHLYGRYVAVHFLHKLRDEERYPDLDTLTRQIAIDADDARRWFATDAR